MGRDTMLVSILVYFKKYVVESKEDILTLSEEDKRLLEKWKSMHGQSQPTAKKTVVSSVGHDTLPNDPAAQPVLLQQILVPVEPSENQHQTHFNIVQVTAGTTGIVSVNPISHDCGPTAVNITNTFASEKNTEAAGAMKLCGNVCQTGHNFEHPEINKRPVEAAQISSHQSSIESDHSYYKPSSSQEASGIGLKSSEEPLKSDGWLEALTQRISRSHVDDLTLEQTPRGSGGGYGLGDDFFGEQSNRGGSGTAANGNENET